MSEQPLNRVTDYKRRRRIIFNALEAGIPVKLEVGQPKGKWCYTFRQFFAGDSIETSQGVMEVEEGHEPWMGIEMTDGQGKIIWMGAGEDYQLSDVIHLGAKYLGEGDIAALVFQIERIKDAKRRTTHRAKIRFEGKTKWLDVAID